ncbi:family 16 glycosylhydrolase [Thalassotalea fonticola]|uniref:Family 16 glycosylhydrolase n=1 Tax=Thalassotalea fonticola TaxID=3065649 RepID=A0ABZ0GSG0_9GAMM|nr:family 16 glycosylhydrolase [Colwelliaceae bacterium S1-1]
MFACSGDMTNNDLKEQQSAVSSWHVDFFDDFNTFNPNNWQDQRIWVNNETHCYVPDNQFGTREVSDGTLKLKVVDIGEKRSCDNFDKHGKQHPDTQYVAGRIASKNLKEFVKGKWSARLKVENSGQSGMFPAWWLLGSQNNEPPVQHPDENVCWPMAGSGEIDIFEHHSDGGPNHYAARAIKSNGECGGGDWQALMLVQEAKLDEYHEYSVEWVADDVIFRLDEVEVYRLPSEADKLSEPFFAILNFAKINDSAMTANWVMEVDWVKHEAWY